MLCSNCHKPIPPGKEIQMSGGWFPWWGGGSETVCKKCSIQKKKNQKVLAIGFITCFLLIMFLPLIFLFIKRGIE